VPEFLVEIYFSRAAADVVAHSAESARIAAEELTREGTPVRYLKSIFVPEDETCLMLYESSSADAVDEAARRAGLQVDRVAAVSSEAGR